MENSQRPSIPEFEPLEVPFSRFKVWRLFLIVASILLGLLIAGLGFEQDWFVLSLIIMVTPILMFAVLFSGRILYRKECALRIDQEGIYENSNALSIGMIEWGQVEEVVPYAINGIYSLKIIVKEPQYFIKNERNWLKRMILKINWKFDSTPIHVTDMLLSITFMDLLREINRRRWEGSPFRDFSEHLID